jgi:hypothetical protein
MFNVKYAQKEKGLGFVVLTQPFLFQAALISNTISLVFNI